MHALALALALLLPAAPSSEEGRAALLQGDAARAYELLAPLARTADADPEVLFDAGRAALLLGRKEEALSFLTRADDALDVPTHAARLAGFLHFERGESRKAYQRLAPWIAVAPNDQPARLTAAACAVQLERFNEVEELVRPLPEDLPQARLLRSELRLRRGMPQEAIEMLTPLLAAEFEASPIAVQARRLSARAALANYDPPTVFELLAGRTAEDSEAALLLAEARYRDGAVDAAIEVLLPHAPSPEIDPQLGRYLTLAGRMDEAIPPLRRAIASKPDDRESRSALSRALFAVGDREAAAEEARRVREIAAGETPTSERNKQYVARTHRPTETALRQAYEKRAAGDFADALELVRAEAELNPDDLRLMTFEIDLLLRLGRTEEALNTAQRVVEVYSEHADAWVLRGNVRAARGDGGGAEEDFRRALRIVPGHIAASNSLAESMLGRGDREAARELLDDVLRRAPENARAKDLRSKLR